MESVDTLTGKKNTMGILEQLAEIREAEGLKRGRKEGRQEEKASVVKNLLTTTKLELETIASCAGVSMAFVLNIKKELAG